MSGADGLGLFLGTEAPVMTPNGVDSSFLLLIPAELYTDEEVGASQQDTEAVLLVPRANDVTEVLHMLEQELAAYEEQELAVTGTGRGGRGPGDRGRAGAARSARLEMEDLVDLAHETALARYGFAQRV